jgi:hypothetical protein
MGATNMESLKAEVAVAQHRRNRRANRIKREFQARSMRELLTYPILAAEFIISAIVFYGLMYMACYLDWMDRL